MMQLLLVLQLLSSCLAGPGEQLEQALKLLQEQQATQRQQQEMQTQLLLIIQQQQQQQNQQQQQMQMLLPPAPFMQVQPQLFPPMLPAQMQMPQMQFPPVAPAIEEIEDEQLQELPWFHCPKPLAPKPPSKEART